MRRNNRGVDLAADAFRWSDTPELFYLLQLIGLTCVIASLDQSNFICVFSVHTKENDSYATDAKCLFQLFYDDCRLATAAQQQYRTRGYKKDWILVGLSLSLSPARHFIGHRWSSKLLCSVSSISCTVPNLQSFLILNIWPWKSWYIPFFFIY